MLVLAEVSVGRALVLLAVICSSLYCMKHWKVLKVLVHSHSLRRQREQILIRWKRVEKLNKWSDALATGRDQSSRRGQELWDICKAPPIGLDGTPCHGAEMLKLLRQRPSRDKYSGSKGREIGHTNTLMAFPPMEFPWLMHTRQDAAC